ETQTLPAGEPSRLRLAAKDAVATGDLTTIADETALTKQIVSGFESTNDRLTFQAKIDQTGDYTVIAYVKSPDYLTLSAPIQFNMGNKEEVQTLLVPPSQYYQPIQVRFSLVEGSEEIILSSEIGVDTVQVDRLEIIQIDEE
ncbi:MAG TPA: glycosyl hydrolase, family 43, partial [Enterococcus sp.]|nr:glycosyl hydrolase, family 43 [Enterococcus sp.]